MLKWPAVQVRAPFIPAITLKVSEFKQALKFNYNPGSKKLILAKISQYFSLDVLRTYVLSSVVVGMFKECQV